ncbi:MAG TPA: beta-L-arabinofuranosidase domain-containing protein [Bacteroidales bacterium]|nr:beta-L-arabinofuranosidase domain-containing protein [Bacteroidales bacterium]
MKACSKYIPALVLTIFLAGSCSRKETGGDYPIKPVPFTSVRLTDDFWAPRIRKNAEITIPIAFGYCGSTGRIKNFEVAGKLDTGKFRTIYPFDDSDVYKIIEGASYSLQTFPDPKLDAFLDTLIYKIGKAQEPDGYLYTNRTIAEMHGGKGLHPWANKKRWLNDSVSSHELYNLGHLYEAAVAHFQATGKRSLLDIALKSADLVNRDFGWDRCRVYPGHQVIELGLVKLYRVTGDKKYLDLAKFFLDVRGPGGQQYNQADLKPVDQTRAEGHAVRATYMYSGMADVAALVNDRQYLDAITRIWEDLVFTKMYITGGIGATGGNEGFSSPYVLPNMTAYCETCASIGDIFFNQRLFLLHGESKYYDILEKTLYNSMLSGVSLSADRFFYPNPLSSAGQHERSAWFGCACCPSNVCRFIPAVPGYIYAVTDKDLYVNLFISDSAEFNIGNEKIRIRQQSGFPWNGKVTLDLNPEKEKKFILRVRLPGWAVNEAIAGNLYRFADQGSGSFMVALNGTAQEIKMNDGYAVFEKKWKKGDRLEINFPMPVRKVVAGDSLKDDAGKVAIQRGPVIYCTEWPDNNDGKVLNLVLNRNAGFSAEYDDKLLGGTEIIRTTGHQTRRNLDGRIESLQDEPLLLIPYAFWNNRGAGEMNVWLPVSDSVSIPLPAPTIAYRSKVTASKTTKSLNLVRDQVMPLNSADQNSGYYHWWPDTNKWEWVQYDFDRIETISKSKVYWFDDSPDGGCRIPDEWKIMYSSGNQWKPVKEISPYRITKNAWDSVGFKPVTTGSVRIMVKLKKNYSSGIHEWVIE